MYNEGLRGTTIQVVGERLDFFNQCGQEFLCRIYAQHTLAHPTLSKPTELFRAAPQIGIGYTRGYRLDEDLARLWDVETRILTRAVRRNCDRFTPDFMFQLSEQEVANLRSQIGISSSSYGGRCYRHLVFTEQGIAMLSTVLRSKKAVRVNIEIMRAFVKLRGFISSNQELARKLAALEQR